jgi:uroporphyrin-III C-methyltransferase/precorrin-2 dehydrogenase/sirohydrochlorin ferrochelatase
MPPLAILPVFFRLTGRRAVVVGGSDAAAWKAELIAACGAEVEVFAASPGARLRSLAAATPRISLIARAWTPADLAGAALAVGDCGSEEEAARLRAAARAASAPVNMIDKPGGSDFQFGAIVERSPLVIGISTDGAAPVFAQSVRGRIEALLPEGLRAWGEAGRAWRRRIAGLGLAQGARRRAWATFAERAFADPGRAPDEGDYAAMTSGAEAAAAAATGSVALVGAGPGDPELLTLKALRALQSADVVLFDDLVAPGVVAMARREALKISVGKRGYKPSCTQEDISAMLIAHAREGRRVIRLKGGDPSIFGRAAEEIDALAAAGVPVEVIPGVTAASAAAASLGRSLTERVRARRLQFVTAHMRGGRLPDDLDLRALADPRATTVVYMGVRTLRPLAQALLEAGLPPGTPAAIIERVASPGERAIVSTIAEIAEAAETAAIKAPALVLIGEALRAPQGGAKGGR